MFSMWFQVSMWHDINWWYLSGCVFYVCLISFPFNHYLLIQITFFLFNINSCLSNCCIKYRSHLCCFSLLWLPAELLILDKGTIVCLILLNVCANWKLQLNLLCIVTYFRVKLEYWRKILMVGLDFSTPLSLAHSRLMDGGSG